MNTISVHIPDSLKSHIERLARADGISVEQFLSLAAAEKVAALDAGKYLAERAARGDRDAFLRVLAKAPSTEPEPWDRLP